MTDSNSKWCTSQQKPRTVDTNVKHVCSIEMLNKPEVVLFGTSMIQGLETIPEMKAIFDTYLDSISCFNCGCGGDRLGNMLYRLDEGMLMKLIYQSHSPRLVIVMGGANDIEQAPVADMILAMKRIIAKIQEEKPVHIAVIGMFPRLSDKKKFKDEKILLELIKQYNKGIEKLTGSGSNSNVNVSYHYAGDAFMKNGKVNKQLYVDNVHFNEKGNEIS